MSLTFLEIFRTNVIKTILFNFKMLPFRKAIKFPVFFYGKVKFRSLKGRVYISGIIKPGMIKVGIMDQYVDCVVPQCVWTIEGTINFSGPLKMARGSYVMVGGSGELNLGSRSSFYGSNLRILCFHKITIGDCARITWDCQIYDTSFHYLENLDGREIVPLQKEVIIGERVWIGNRSTVSKGAVIPDDTIVASNSLVNKDFSDIDSYSMLAGLPAKLKISGVRRVWSREEERKLDNKFGYKRHKL